MRLGSVDAGGRAEFRVLHHADGVAVAFVTRHAASVAVTRVGVEAAGGPGGALATGDLAGGRRWKLAKWVESWQMKHRRTGGGWGEPLNEAFVDGGP